jgi:hypothetical protein
VSDGRSSSVLDLSPFTLHGRMPRTGVSWHRPEYARRVDPVAIAIVISAGSLLVSVGSLGLAVSTRLQLGPRVRWTAWAVRDDQYGAVLYVEAYNARPTSVSVRLESVEVDWAYSWRRPEHDLISMPTQQSSWVSMDARAVYLWPAIPAHDLAFRVTNPSVDVAILKVRVGRSQKKVRVEFRAKKAASPELS